MAIAKAEGMPLFALWLFGEILPQNQGSPTVSRPLATCARRTQRDFRRKTRWITRHRKAKPPHKAPQARPARRHCGRRTPKTRQHLMVSPQTRKPARLYRRQCTNTPFGPDPSPSPAQQKGPSREAGAKEREAMGREPAGKRAPKEREATPKHARSLGTAPGREAGGLGEGGKGTGAYWLEQAPRRGRQRDGAREVPASPKEREANPARRSLWDGSRAGNPGA